MDVPGSGRSDKPLQTYTIANFLQLIHEFISKLGIAPLSLVGTSFGGFLASRYCLEYPEEVRSLILLNASGIRACYPRILQGFRMPLIRYLLPYLLMLPREIKYWVKARIFPRTAPCRILLREYRYSTLTLRSWPGLRASLRAIGSITEQDLMDDRLGNIRCPVLVVWGEQDHLLPKEMAGVFHRTIPSSRLLMIPRCGHNIPEEKPMEVVEAIRRFLGDSPHEMQS
jgi:pimeloyl-ACP methyl ester carboxylesterase